MHQSRCQGGVIPSGKVIFDVTNETSVAFLVTVHEEQTGHVLYFDKGGCLCCFLFGWVVLVECKFMEPLLDS